MLPKIAVIASSINHIRQKHLLDWYNDISKYAIRSQLFLGSRNKHIPYAINYKINSKWDELKYFPWIYFINKNLNLKKTYPLIKFNPSIIHLLTSNQYENIEALLKYDKSIKLIVSFRGCDIYALPHENKANHEILKRIFEQANVLHFISKGLRDM